MFNDIHNIKGIFPSFRMNVRYEDNGARGLDSTTTHSLTISCNLTHFTRALGVKYSKLLPPNPQS